MPTIDFTYHETIRECIVNSEYGFNDDTDWFEWRHCYEGGAEFREKFLEEYVGKEDTAAFERRKKLTPIPTYAKREINRVRNSLVQRMVDVNRTGGSKVWNAAINGKGRGVDRRGLGINAFLAKKVIAELLVMGQVGCLVDAPLLENVRSKRDVPKNFAPYLQRFVREHIKFAIPADEDSVSDWSNVLLKVKNRKFNLLNGTDDCESEYRYYFLEDDRIERFGKVNVAFLDKNGDLKRPIFRSNLDAIPFVLFDIQQSLMADVAQYQIALLNMISADTSYGLDANYSILTRQRGNAGDAGSHLEGGKGDDIVKTGSQRGLWYGKGYDRPGFISPDTSPIEWSLEQRREMKKEIRELVMSELEGMGEGGEIEDGLAFIGGCMEVGERRLWDHYVVFEETIERRRKVPSVHYPEEWSLLTNEERLEAATKFMKLANVMVGRKNKQAMAINAADKMHRGKMSTKELDDLKAEIRSAPYAISDPEVIFKAKKEGVMSAETASLAIGNLEGEAEKAKQDAAERAAQVVAAQSDAQGGAANGNPDGSVNPNSNKLAREGDTEAAGKLKEARDPGRPTKEKE